MYTKKLFTKSLIACTLAALQYAARLIQATIITGSGTIKNQLLPLPFPQRQRRIQTGNT
ncbi:hypothetical protein QTN47_19530 [Danxiaibacter flavus]|uniref:Uncharacterized protein n=1 Tax=Danxiaibacter flavus TaxID=3049108 RepID=A0ABV3ZII8_9BACT|nr:hypothetical protein QNM32_19540 [Chitinophagaceae bacterium DXS]